jgi:hypothetical protein
MRLLQVKERYAKHTFQNISFGFTSTDADDEEGPIYLLCTQIVAVASIGPNTLKNHLETVRVEFVRKHLILLQQTK